jgi:protein Mpv17
VVFLATKVAADQFIFEPPSLLLFFATHNFLQGRDLATLSNALKDEFVTVFKTDCALWIPLQVFNFSLVPVLWQPLLINSVCIAWTAFLSYVQSKPNTTVEPQT